MTIVIYELDKIHSSYNRLKYSKLIPCNCVNCKDSQDPHFYAFEVLQKFIKDGQPQIQCQKSYQMVKVSELIDDVITKFKNNINQSQTSLDIEPNKEIFISYAWNGESEEIVNQLDRAFQNKEVTIIRDKRDLGYKGLIKDFMKRIGRGKCVIVVISKKYLESENCMFELVQIAKNDKFYERIFPIALDDAKIYKPIDRIQYVQYWENQFKELDEAMKTVSAANLQGFREDIDLYAEIRQYLPQLTNILRDMNTLTAKIHSESGFDELFKAVERKIAE